MFSKILPKIIVVSGAHSNVGKTKLAYQLCSLLDNAIRVKIGHHSEKKHGDSNYYYAGTPFFKILEEHRQCRYLIIESNHIISEIQPDCLIFLTGQKKAKPSADTALKKADIVRGRSIKLDRQEHIAKMLVIDMNIVRKIIKLSGAYS